MGFFWNWTRIKTAPYNIHEQKKRSAAHDIRSKWVKEFRLCLHFDLVYSRERACQSNRIHLPVIRLISISTVYNEMLFRKTITFDVASPFSFSHSPNVCTNQLKESKKRVIKRNAFFYVYFSFHVLFSTAATLHIYFFLVLGYSLHIQNMQFVVCIKFVSKEAGKNWPLHKYTT